MITYGDIFLAEPTLQTTLPTLQTTLPTREQILTKCQPTKLTGKLDSVSYLVPCESDMIFRFLSTSQAAIIGFLTQCCLIFYPLSMQVSLQRVGVLKKGSLHFLFFLCPNYGSNSVKYLNSNFLLRIMAKKK